MRQPDAGWLSPFVVSSPHSGRTYPGHFMAASGLDPLSLRKSEDCFVDELVAGAAQHGAPVLSANFPRAFCDANREPYELDPKLFREPLPAYATTHTPRVMGGLGTIARVVSEAEPIYRRAPRLDDCLIRIERLHHPYHAALTRLRDAAQATHGV
ncbi:MAG: N-formylglutamate amidohydrolase, partial [Pseudomonadota bacterium]